MSQVMSAEFEREEGQGEARQNAFCLSSPLA